VVDIGGTTTDVGALVSGLPRPAAKTVSLAGVRTNFRLPDLLALGLGGGSVVTWGSATAPATAGSSSSSSSSQDIGAAGAGPPPCMVRRSEAEGLHCSVGPLSVGAGLLQRCLLRGGDTCTAADVAALMGKATGLGDAAAVRPGLLPSGRQLAAAWQEMQVKLAEAVDHMKVGCLAAGGPAVLACWPAPSGSSDALPSLLLSDALPSLLLSDATG
jgi:N-methylhydantoinase A/oxoprolinase/acetone carboxylase beta subunit